jgi:hypothetical protein
MLKTIIKNKGSKEISETALKMTNLGKNMLKLREWTYHNVDKIVCNIMDVDVEDQIYQYKKNYVLDKLDIKQSIGQFIYWLKRDNEKFDSYIRIYSNDINQPYDVIKKDVDLYADIYKYLYNASDLYKDLDYTVKECNIMIERYMNKYHNYELRISSNKMSDTAKENLYNNMYNKYYVKTNEDKN